VTVVIDIKAINYGTQNEILNLTFQIGAVSGEQTIAIAFRNSTTLNCSWTTADSAKGYYVVKAYAAPVLGETDTEDNTYAGSVYIGVPGDVDGNHIVNMVDLRKIATNLNAETGDPNYASNYDINSDSMINMIDLLITAENFGRTDF
jgi:hypothetical protein